MDEVGFLVGWVVILVSLLEGLVLWVDIAGETKKIRETYGFGLQAMIEGSLGVSGPCILQIPCGT